MEEVEVPLEDEIEMGITHLGFLSLMRIPEPP